MAGVIDKNGVQWERCNSCGCFTRMSTMEYEEPCSKYRFGRDLCRFCATAIRVCRNHPGKEAEWVELHRASHIGIPGEEHLIKFWVEVNAVLPIVLRERGE